MSMLGGQINESSTAKEYHIGLARARRIYIS